MGATERILDANMILRFLLNDNIEMSDKVNGLIKKSDVLILHEVVAEEDQRQLSRLLYQSLLFCYNLLYSFKIYLLYSFKIYLLYSFKICLLKKKNISATLYLILSETGENQWIIY